MRCVHLFHFLSTFAKPYHTKLSCGICVMDVPYEADALVFKLFFNMVISVLIWIVFQCKTFINLNRHTHGHITGINYACGYT